MSVAQRWLDVFETRDAGELQALALELGEDDLGWLGLHIWSGAPEESAFLGALLHASDLVSRHPFARALQEANELAQDARGVADGPPVEGDSRAAPSQGALLADDVRLDAISYVAERFDDLDVRRAFVYLVAVAPERWRSSLMDRVVSGSPAVAVACCWVSRDLGCGQEIRRLASQRAEPVVARFLSEVG